MAHTRKLQPRDRTSLSQPVYIGAAGERTIVQERRVGYWGPPRPPKEFGRGRNTSVITYGDPPEGTKDDWVILCDKPGARGPFTERRTIVVSATEWEQV